MKKEIVLGPPGTGKTTTLLSYVDEELARGTPPDRIGYISFTRRAAEEASTRACEKFGLTKACFPWFRTIHSLCFQVLGMRSSEVFNGRKLLREFADEARIRVTGYFSEDGTLTGYEQGDRALFLDNLARIRCIPLRQLYLEFDEEPGIGWTELNRVSLRLAAFKQERGLLDFTDMLAEFVKMGQQVNLKVLFVDEAQDLSPLQWRVVWKLAETCERVVVAGDDDQAIYTWAGADVDHLIQMEGQASVLGKSYRVPRSVQHVAQGLINRVKVRRPKEWEARDDEGTVDGAFSVTDMRLDSSDILILARNKMFLDPIEDSLRKRGIIFERLGHLSVSAPVVDAVVSWEKLRRGEGVEVSQARRIYKQMSSGPGVARGFKELPGFDDGEVVTESMLRGSGGLVAQGPWFEALDRVPEQDREYIRSALRNGEKLTAKPRVRLQTIHTSKGGEADHVVMLLGVTRQTHRGQERKPEEELRTWYVGATRAKQRLTLVQPDSEYGCAWL